MNEPLPNPSQAAVYVLLSRHNLPPVASTRLIRPRLAYGKYYGDVLDLRPDTIPVFGTPPGQDIATYCTREGTGSFPVLIELDGEAVTSEELKNGGTQRLIPAEHIRRIHVRTAADLAELRAHEYENSNLTEYQMDVSPLLFSGDGLSLTALRSHLAVFPPGLPGTAERIAAANRITGGLLAVASHGRAEEAQVEALFRRNLQVGENDHTDVAFLVRTLFDGLQNSTEARLLHVIATVLTDLPQGEQPATEDLLLQYRREYLQRYPDDIKGLRIIERAEHVMITQQFRPGSDASTPVAFALLLHVMRQRLTELTQEDRGLAPFFESGVPGRSTVNIARFLTGLRLGRQRMDTFDRPPLLDVLAASEEAAAVQMRPARLLTLLDPIQAVQEDREFGNQKVAAVVPGQSGTGQPAPTETPEEEAARAASGLMDNVSLEKLATEAPLEIPGATEPADLTIHAVAISQLRGWDDLVITTVMAAGPVVVSPERAGRVSLRLIGPVQVTTSVEQTGELQRRLEAAPLTSEELSRIAGAPSEAGTVKKAGRPRKAAAGGSASRKRKQGKMEDAVEQVPVAEDSPA